MENADAWLKIRHQASRRWVATVFGVLGREGLQAVLIKGYAASLHYPEPWMRPFSDIDICIAPNNYEFAKTIIAKENLPFGIDLHRGVRNLHFSSFEEILARSISVDVEGTTANIPCPEDHLVILATHWLNDGGARRERLGDLRHLLESSPAFDWSKCRKGMPANRQRWLGLALAACIRFGGLQRSLVELPESMLFLSPWVEKVLSKEWSDDGLAPLYDTEITAREFLRQLRKRIPPNPLEAIVECDGDVDSALVPWYQIVSLLKRIPRGLLMQTQRLRMPWRRS